jgi:2-polyprenyl-3-methyl-5-hydroxy-6-metoxy-1,4-benzoquinol methylase
MGAERLAAEFFDGFADSFDTIYDQKRNPLMQYVDRTFRSDMFIRFARTFEIFGDLTEKSVLDIGCGSGPYVAEALRRNAKHVTAVDPAPRMLQLVRKRLEGNPWEERCSIVEGLFPGVNVPTHDHVVVVGVMDYVDAGSFLRELRPLVRQSAVLTFPSKHWFRTPFRKFRYWLRRCPVTFYDAPQIEQLCSAAGFAQTDIYKIPGAGMDYHVCVRN